MRNPMHEARAALALHPRCGAHCRTTGSPCMNPAMRNGRCRMHGGASTGRPKTTGAYTNTISTRTRRASELIAAIRDLTQS